MTNNFERSALIVGATGLVGSMVLDALLLDDYYESITVISRRSSGKHHRKLKEIIVDFDKLEENSAEIKANHVFCCLGTTINAAGSKEKFVLVDKIYPIKLAKICKENGATEFLVITALGASKNSWIFYNKVKGSLQDELIKLKFESLHILQPSLIMGERTENRGGEKLAQLFFEKTNFLFQGPLKKYAGIDAKVIASSMVYYAKEGTKGCFIHPSDEIQQVWNDFYNAK